MSPRYTIIIPVEHFQDEERVLVRLRQVAPAAGMQILVAVGSHPARQRNAALGRATGEIIVFLDNDCSIGAEYWNELESDFARPGVEVVGGPALLRPEAGGPERIFHALLTHPLVVGPICARYAARGAFRVASQTELILCNLAARREVFEKIGHLPVELYPNEENEWLDRAEASGVGIYYDPRLQVFRPQRKSWGAMARMLVRYGVGRTKQLQISGWHFTLHQAAPLVLLVPLAALYKGAEAAFGAGWLILALLVALTCGSGLGMGQRLLAGLVAPLVPFLYALGQVLGWFRLGVASPGATAEITVVDETGKALGAGSK
jgi:8-oxo-dGTP pyrophosphatase MutT (NUDIX family)